MKYSLQLFGLILMINVFTACQKEDNFQNQQDRMNIVGTYALQEICLLPSKTHQKSVKQGTENWSIVPDETDESKIYIQALGVYGIVKATTINIPSQTHEGMKTTIVGYGTVINDQLHLYYSLTDHIWHYTKTCEVYGIKKQRDF